VNGVVAVPAKKSWIGRTIERSNLIAKFTSFIALHHIYDYIKLKMKKSMYFSLYKLFYSMVKELNVMRSL
jgi:hypothetical protein